MARVAGPANLAEHDDSRTVSRSATLRARNGLGVQSCDRLCRVDGRTGVWCEEYTDVHGAGNLVVAKDRGDDIFPAGAGRLEGTDASDESVG